MTILRKVVIFRQLLLIMTVIHLTSVSLFIQFPLSWYKLSESTDVHCFTVSKRHWRDTFSVTLCSQSYLSLLFYVTTLKSRGLKTWVDRSSSREGGNLSTCLPFLVGADGNIELPSYLSWLRVVIIKFKLTRSNLKFVEIKISLKLHIDTNFSVMRLLKVHLSFTLVFLYVINHSLSSGIILLRFYSLFIRYNVVMFLINCFLSTSCVFLYEVDSCCVNLLMKNGGSSKILW